MPDLAVVPARPTPAPPRPLWGPTQGQGAHTVEGADWDRWPLVQPHLLRLRLVQLGILQPVPVESTEWRRRRERAAEVAR